MGTGSSTIQFAAKARAISPEKNRGKFQFQCYLKSLQGRAWQGHRSWLLLFGGWIKLAAPSLLPKQGDNFNRQSGILLKCI